MTLEVDRYLAGHGLAGGALPSPDVLQALHDARAAALVLLHPSRRLEGYAALEEAATDLSHVLRRTAMLALDHDLAVVVADIWVDLDSQVLAAHILSEVGHERRACHVLQVGVTEVSKRLNDIAGVLARRSAPIQLI